MHIQILPTTVDRVADLRFLFAREFDDIILYEREIQRGETRVYRIWNGSALAGYGILHGEGEDRSKVKDDYWRMTRGSRASARFFGGTILRLQISGWW